MFETQSFPNIQTTLALSTEFFHAVGQLSSLLEAEDKTSHVAISAAHKISLFYIFYYYVVFFDIMPSATPTRPCCSWPFSADMCPIIYTQQSWDSPMPITCVTWLRRRARGMHACPSPNQYGAQCKHCILQWSNARPRSVCTCKCSYCGILIHD